MTPRIPFSDAANRTSPPAISELMQVALANPGLISLAAGFVDQGSLPVGPVAEAIASIAADPVESRRALQYGTTAGDRGLRSQIVGLLERSEGVKPGTYASAHDRILITTGSQQLLYLVAEALINPGDIVIVEAPTYFVYLGVLETQGARAVGVPIDDGGMRLDALEQTLVEIEARGELDRVKLIYTISEHSNPSGISLAADRRGPLVELAKRWSKRHQILILEDVAYRGVCFDGHEAPSVWSHDPEGETVILARSFSKTFSPGLKTGFGVLPPALHAVVHRLKGNHDFGSSHLNQQILDHVLASGTFDRHLAKLVAMYRRKRDVMLGALETYFGGADSGVSWTHPHGGLFVWLTAPEGVDTGPHGSFFARCLERGVLYVPGSYCYAAEGSPAPTNQARLCFGVPGETELKEGIRRLSAAMSDCLIETV
ncbi:PLP-dependent aminotransferase family protein [Isosphaeraceae bacterium EP7]